MTTESFKKLLSSYYEYQKNISKIKDELEDLLYQMTNVKAIRYDKAPSSFNPGLNEEIRLDLIEKKEEMETELEYTILAIRLIEMKLKKLSPEDKQICLEILNRKVTYEQAAIEKGYSKNALWSQVKKKIEGIL